MLVYTYKEVVFYTLFEICTKTSFRLTNILLKEKLKREGNESELLTNI